MQDPLIATSRDRTRTCREPADLPAMGEIPDPLRIAALDDDPGDLELLRRALEEMQGGEVLFEGHLLADGLLAAARRRPPDLIFVDHCLGSRTGLEILDELEAGGCRQPVILLTGQGSEEIAAAAVRAGMADYLPKRSLSARTLEKTVLNAIEKSRLRESLRLYATRLERANRDLQKRNEEIQRFYHTLSHQLKTPLTVAREFVALLLDGQGGKITEEQHEYLEIAKESCDQLAVSVNDLLDISLLDSGELCIRPEACALTDVMERVLASMEPRAAEENITLRWSAPASLPPVWADPLRLGQVLGNLASNALKYTSSEGKVLVTAQLDSEDTESVRVAVRDTGEGIAPEQIERVFDRLGHVTEDEGVTGRGLGMGLTLCKELIRLSGGTLRVESVPGNGTTFSFTIPLAEYPRRASPVQGIQPNPISPNTTNPNAASPNTSSQGI